MQPLDTGGEDNTASYSKRDPHQRSARQLVLTAWGDLAFVARALSKSVAPHRRGVSNPRPVVRRREIANLEPDPPDIKPAWMVGAAKYRLADLERATERIVEVAEGLTTAQYERLGRVVNRLVNIASPAASPAKPKGGAPAWALAMASDCPCSVPLPSDPSLSVPGRRAPVEGVTR